MAQPNDITLKELNPNAVGSSTLTNTYNTESSTFTRLSGPEDNKSVYIEDGHTSLNRDMMTLRRGFPVRSGNSYGIMKCHIKFHKDFSVLGTDGETHVQPGIANLSLHVPVGAEVNFIDEVLPRLAAICLTEAGLDTAVNGGVTLVEDMIKNGEI